MALETDFDDGLVTQKKRSEKSKHSPAARRLAKDLATMSYGDLKEIATSMRDTDRDRAQAGETFDLVSDWMDFLHGWSKRTLETEQ